VCRHLAYLGPPLPLSALLYDPPHGLVHQSWAPKDMRGGGTVNADGFGVGWYVDGCAEPVRYRRDCPMWTDAALPRLVEATAAPAFLAAARSATVGMPVVETAAAPFADGRWLFSHNGAVAGWPAAVAGLAARLPVVDLMTLDAPTDAAFLFALVRRKLRTGHDAATAIASVTADVVAVAPGSRLNLLLTDGRQVAATTYGHSLSVRHGDGAVVVASEPLDDSDSWQPVPDHRLLTATAEKVDVRPL